VCDRYFRKRKTWVDPTPIPHDVINRLAIHFWQTGCTYGNVDEEEVADVITEYGADPTTENPFKFVLSTTFRNNDALVTSNSFNIIRRIRDMQRRAPPLPRPLVVYRSFGKLLKVRDVATHTLPFSTSMISSGASGGDMDEGQILVITMPAGFKNTLHIWRMHDCRQEEEVILPPCDLVVTRIRRDDTIFTKVYCVAIPIVTRDYAVEIGGETYVRVVKVRRQDPNAREGWYGGTDRGL